MRFIICTIFLLQSILCCAQTTQQDTIANNSIVFSIDNNFNNKDWFLGLSIGYHRAKYLLNVKAKFAFRPRNFFVFEYEGNNLYYQFLETRSILSLNADKIFPFINKQTLKFGPAISLAGGYSWGSYPGTKRKPVSGLIAIPGIGAGILFCGHHSYQINLGAEYLRLFYSNISPIRYTVSFSYIL